MRVKLIVVLRDMEVETVDERDAVTHSVGDRDVDVERDMELLTDMVGVCVPDTEADPQLEEDMEALDAKLSDWLLEALCVAVGHSDGEVLTENVALFVVLRDMELEPVDESEAVPLSEGVGERVEDSDAETQNVEDTDELATSVADGIEEALRVPEEH